MLRKTAEKITPSLTKLFNASLSTGKFPSKWKTANVTLLHKKDDKQTTKNYRPISLLCIVGKALERCVHNVLFSYLLENNLITPLQSAYQPGNSTTTQLLDLYHQMMTALDEGKELRFIFMEVSKAFDRVWHDGVIYKLRRAGIGGTLLSWFRNYLEDRKQKVVVEGAESSEREILAGVPQGSILGPILFILYVNDIVNHLNLNLRLYADDATLFITYDNPFEAAEILQHNLDLATQWANNWLVKFNPTKTESMVVSRRKDSITPIVQIEDVDITNVSKHKHLGVNLQSNGKWSSHIQEIKGKAQKRLDILRGYMHKLDRNSLEKMYLTYVRPIIEYSDVVWDNCTQKEKEEIEAIQLAAARVITGAKRGTEHALLYNELQWETLEERRHKHKLIMMHKVLTQTAPLPLLTYKPETSGERHNYNIRRPDHLIVPKCSTTLMQKSFFPDTTYKWNDLPEELKNIETTEELKEKIKHKKSPKPPYNCGTRRGQILQARLRLKCSDLNSHLAPINLAESTECQCGAENETVHHFLLSCPMYTNIRRELYFNITANIQINEKVLLFGSNELSNVQNENIFISVQNYILMSERF